MNHNTNNVVSKQTTWNKHMIWNRPNIIKLSPSLKVNVVLQIRRMLPRSCTSPDSALRFLVFSAFISVCGLLSACKLLVDVGQDHPYLFWKSSSEGARCRVETVVLAHRGNECENILNPLLKVLPLQTNGQIWSDGQIDEELPYLDSKAKLELTNHLTIFWGKQRLSHAGWRLLQYTIGRPQSLRASWMVFHIVPLKRSICPFPRGCKDAWYYAKIWMRATFSISVT